MNKNFLDSFDEDKKKCVRCKKYFDKKSFYISEYACFVLVSTACKNCEGKDFFPWCVKKKEFINES